MTRRQFLFHAGAVGLGLLSSRAALSAPAARRRPELRITRILVQDAKGRRLTPVAPNAYAVYRGYDVREPVLRIQTAQGLEGICNRRGTPEQLKQLLGLDPFALFEWDGDVVRGPAETHRKLLADLAGSDVALFDLLGRALRRPVAELLGKRVRSEVTVYDSSLYMEDLLKPAEREGLTYLEGAAPGDDAELVARKAEWILRQPYAVRVLKIKIGRAKWMASFDEALARDIAVFKAVRRAVGKSIKLFVDGNDGYKPRPHAAAEFAEATGPLGLYAMEEMFPDALLPETHELKRRLRAAGLKTKLADGEDNLGGIRPKSRVERFAGPRGEEPLFDIDQGDMNAAGYLRLRETARDCATRGMTMAPHNFGSKFGFYAMVHLGLVTPNWEFCESDDTQIPALVPAGFSIRKGMARLTGEPGLGLKLNEDKLEKPSLKLEV
jgi:L-alanine-DL-glutamate epimerase-like enolase superfamily enzyme